MNKTELNTYRKSGRIASEVVKWSKPLIKENAKLVDIADKIESKIKELGGEIAFPVNTCINDVAAHYAPKFNDNSYIKSGDVVKIDIGVHVDGFIADTAYTIDISGDYTDMLKANESALNNIIKLVKPGASLNEIGEAANNTISDAGFRVIENLTGHEVKQYDLHAGISIPNIPVPFDKKLKEGMVIAVEPFATDGYGRVIEGKVVEIFSLIKKKPVRMIDARNLINEVESRNGLPFAERWFSKKINPAKLQLILPDLVKRKVLKQYPMLHEKNKGVVSQFEHTLIVTEDGCEVTTR